MTTAEKYRRIKHALGLKLMAEGKTAEARLCFEAVWASAKGEVGS